ncbi:hypothetical protein SARC_14200 [Sphaeroforma arctica JP610]|uniref:Uncharacterized protein n=1 Tax=Sphaeroforma arctica JP610 TaxID=667725 RepID=A0A0L0F941_9EUKA|nr:hypothetical protein SARC_14200 [Sphaeroforma arctica JP610]KNC73240.1 hypothetical protein SARC_14200 [Sphaeroforma arctica JP610]|eukprot:XP_014147142.1 hypothetical protein SARC_14200 [Sphaeroforma arctica JP610]
MLLLSGGIGSTHDDITYDAIAKTFGVQLEYHQPTLDLMTKYVKSKGAQDSKFSEEHKRMAYFPEGSKVHQTGDLWVPLVVTKNVHILPGVPILFSRLLELHGALFQQDVRLTTENLWSTERESDLAAALGLVQGNNPGVTVGSYPRFTEKGIQGVLLSFEGEDPEAVKQAVTEARASIKCEDTIPAKHITN